MGRVKLYSGKTSINFKAVKSLIKSINKKRVKQVAANRKRKKDNHKRDMRMKQE